MEIEPMTLALLYSLSYKKACIYTFMYIFTFFLYAYISVIQTHLYRPHTPCTFMSIEHCLAHLCKISLFNKAVMCTDYLHRRPVENINLLC